MPIVKALADASDSRKGKSTAWREAKVCHVQRQREVVALGGVTMDGTAEAGAILKQLPRAPGFNAKTQGHCVGDGAPWMADPIAEQFGTHVTPPGASTRWPSLAPWTCPLLGCDRERPAHPRAGSPEAPRSLAAGGPGASHAEPGRHAT